MSDSSLTVPDAVMETLRAELPTVARSAASAVIDEVPAYNEMRGPEGATLDRQVELALKGFLLIASGSRSDDAAAPLQPVLDAAFALGRGEFRNGRTMDVLLSAYRIGARASWREWSRVSIRAGIGIDLLSRFAELIFAYIDELSASSVAGYTFERESSERSRTRRLEELGRKLLTGGPVEALQADADRAGWDPPENLCAVLMRASSAQGVRSKIDNRSLVVPGELPGLEGEDFLLLLVPATAAERSRIKETLEDRDGVIGPSRPWHEAGSSYTRALKAQKIRRPGGRLLDANDFLIELVVGADAEALDDLRRSVLSPLDAVRATTREKLVDTLRAWLLHQGRREEIASALHIHPQTVRYRMGQIRDLYGDRLDDPSTILAATVALAEGSGG
ncbi:MAG: helix-turn-helix domain-containing protein [Solirubrobacterales bacterium]|nr:helix-turn-helix domain-containing protein [Solirubrobacterales bacterium]